MRAITHFDSPIGKLTIAADNDAITGLWLAGQKRFMAGHQDLAADPDTNLPAHDAAKDWLRRYFAGENPALDGLLLKPAGTDYERLVFSLLCQIPFGRTVSYADIAREIFALRTRSTSPRAVGGAIGKNPISIIIPCHRVIGSDKSLTGFAGGLLAKQWLLNHEAGAKSY
jgi:methylated-DNA-[protein]-cysteine S-methyltransferase